MRPPMIYYAVTQEDPNTGELVVVGSVGVRKEQAGDSHADKILLASEEEEKALKPCTQKYENGQFVDTVAEVARKSAEAAKEI